MIKGPHYSAPAFFIIAWVVCPWVCSPTWRHVCRGRGKIHFL